METFPVGQILASRYLPAAAVVATLYDHLLTLDDEIRTIWTKAPDTSASYGSVLPMKMSFVFGRYLCEAVMFYVAYMTGGFLVNQTDLACIQFLWVYSIAGFLFVTVTQFMLVQRLYNVWDHRKGLIFALAICCLLSVALASAGSILGAVQASPHVHFMPFPIQSCVFDRTPPALTITIVALLFFNVCLVIMAFWHSISTPTRVEDIKTRKLHRDGARLFLFLAILRLGTLITNFASPSGVNFGVLSLVWGLNSIIGSRLHLRTEGLALFTLPSGESVSSEWRSANLLSRLAGRRSFLNVNGARDSSMWWWTNRDQDMVAETRRGETEPYPFRQRNRDSMMAF